jgi:glutamate-ammonia-ligase adenylyltransferase
VIDDEIDFILSVFWGYNPQARLFVRRTAFDMDNESQGMMTLVEIPSILAGEYDQKWSNFQRSLTEARLPRPFNPDRVPSIRKVFTLSDFVFKNCIRHPELIEDFIQTRDLDHGISRNAWQDKIGRHLESVATEDDLMDTLRRIRRREMVRIAWRDLAGCSEIQETMAELTGLTEILIDEALKVLYKWHCASHGVPHGKSGKPQRLVVIGMGKLGGGEMNFSSDVDIIFAYSETGQTQGHAGGEGTEAFFNRLCRSLVKVLGTRTVEGQVFRVDTRLRPFGENGPIVMHFDSMENYYQIQGREWERYAWIKARAVAGDLEDGRQLVNRLSPFIYRRYLDYGAFEALRDMKRRIALEVARKEMKDNVKLGPGGIREIEFFAQAFQLIRGGVAQDLQERSLGKVLEVLARDGYVPAQVCGELWEAYKFLRMVENRLQEFDDQQTHTIPGDDRGKSCLALSMGFSKWSELQGQLTAIMSRVHHHFSRILEPEEIEENPDNPMAAVWENFASVDQTLEILTAAGFADPSRAARLLDEFRTGFETRALSKNGRERLNRLIPAVLRQVGRCRQPDVALGRILDLIRTIERRTCYLSLLLENPEALAHLIHLSLASPWVISFLSQHPVLLDELLDPRTLYLPPEREELRQDIRHRLDRTDTADLEYVLEALCIFKQANTLRVAAADVTGALPLMKVSDHLSYIAETVLEKILEIAWNYLTENHGIPECNLDGAVCQKGFAVAAYGKLGGLELGYSSDLDLVFLHAGTASQTHGGKRPMDSPQFYSRLGQRVIHMLTARTRAGFLYDADMRLRPSGDSGLLVSHIDAFRQYQMEDAWTWEHQALVRSRSIAGDKDLARRFEVIRREVLCKPRDPEKLKQQVLEMRDRVRKEHFIQKGKTFDLKQARGGIVDIEFLVQYLVLRHAHKHPEITRWTDNVRLLEALSTSGILSLETAYPLRQAYLTYRAAVHRESLQNSPDPVSEFTFDRLREKVATLIGRLFASA